MKVTSLLLSILAASAAVSAAPARCRPKTTTTTTCAGASATSPAVVPSDVVVSPTIEVPSPVEVSPSPSPSPSPVAVCNANGGDDLPAIPGVRPRVVSKCKEPGMYALTFDDGVYKYEPEILDKLDGFGVKATFFLNSNLYVDGSVAPYPSWIKDMYDRGHQVASHTATHKNLVGMEAADVLKELAGVDNLIEQTIGKKPAMFRPPYGSMDDASLKLMEQHGYTTVVTWNSASVDYAHNDAAQSMEKVVESIETNCPVKGSAPVIILNHSPLTDTSRFVDLVVPYVLSRGYRFVTVSECVGAPAYL